LKECNFHDKKASIPPGHAVNFGFDDFNHDDRKCECLPSVRCGEIKKDNHRNSMVRFHQFLMAADLNMADEIACTVLLDMSKAMQFGKFGAISEMRNPEFHLHFNELSLLFGGHCMSSKKGDKDHMVDQITHKDRETFEGETKNKVRLKDKHKPGSFIIALDEPRTIFVKTPPTSCHF
jgi:hypothetical protein